MTPFLSLGDLLVAADLVGPALLLSSLVLYALPSLVARTRGHHHLGPIVLINLFLGWTFVGWVIALAWSASAVPPANAGV